MDRAMPPLEADSDDNSRHRYLVFQLGGERYGVPLLQIREVIKMSPVKPVPYTVPHFLGVINLRGQIVSVIDLRSKLGIRSQETTLPLILIVETGNVSIGAVVDTIDSVREFRPEQIETEPAIETKIPPKFLIGVTKSAPELTILMDVSSAIASENMKTLAQLKEIA